MGIFSALKNVISSGVREINADYGKNTDFLEAVCGAAALVANADGSIDDTERSKAVSVISNHSTLKTLYKVDVIKSVLETAFGRAKDASGRQEIARSLEKVKENSKMSEDAYLVAVDIANADGKVGPEEETMLAKIASRLGVNAKDLDF